MSRLRGLYNQVEKLVTPLATQVIGTDEFAKVVAAVTAINKAVRSEADKVQARTWHALNLPAGTDVERLRQQVGSLDRELRLLSLELQRARQQARREAKRGGTSGTEHD